MKNLNHTYTVLTVDDDKNILSVIDHWLKKGGYISCCAQNANEAIEIIDSKNIDIALIDYRMPGTNGFALIKNIREKYSFPIMVISSESEELSQVVGLNSGADDYITKPFSEIVLLAKLKSQLRRSYSFCLKSFIPIKSDGSIRLNCETDEITNGTDSVSLTHQEAIIVRNLIQQSGNPVALEDLCERLNFPPETQSSHRKIQSTVSRLNGKLADNGIYNGLIVTVRKLGYTILP